MTLPASWGAFFGIRLLKMASHWSASSALPVDRPVVLSGTTLAIILGASAWPKSPELSPSSAFSNSAKGFLDYLLDKSLGFGLPVSNVLDLFDNEGSPAEM